MDKQDFLKFSPIELAKIEELKNELKLSKLQTFLLDLLEKNDVAYIDKIVDKKIDFYANLDVLSVLKKAVEIITINIFRTGIEVAIENVKNIQEKKHMYIKDMFVESLVDKLNELEKDFLIEDGLTSPQIEGSPYHKKILKIAQQVLVENPQYVDKFKNISLKEFKVLSKVIYLENKLPEKNSKEKRVKI